MIIAIRKEPNGSIYMDKTICAKIVEIQDERGNITILPLFSDDVLSNPPYNYTKVEIDDKYSDCIGADFNEDLTFNVEKYNARKQKENEQLYVDKIVAKIRLRCSINDELAILRQATIKPEEFSEYNAYVEQCKAEVKNAIN